MAMADFKRLSKRKNATRIISRDDFKRIHEESLRVLETVGIRIYSPAALDLLKEHGADVDDEKMTARIPHDLVERSIASAPKEFRMGARNSDFDIELDNSHVYFTFDGCGVQTIDIDSGKKRPSRKQDIVDCARLANVLPGVGYFTPSVAPQDVPLHAHVLHQI